MKFGEEGKQEMRTGAEPGDQLFGGAELGPLVPAATTGQKRGASANYLPHRRSSCRSCYYLTHLFFYRRLSAAKDQTIARVGDCHQAERKSF